VKLPVEIYGNGEMVKRIESNQIGEKAVLLVERIFNDTNWMCNRLSRDFGIDLHVKVFESEHAAPWEFHVQIKGTKRPHVSKGHIHFVIDTKHLKDWYDSPLPVLFVICNVQSEKAYWLLVKEHLDELDLDWQDQSTITLRIPINNELRPETLPQIYTDLRRRTLMHEARKVIALLEEPNRIIGSTFGISSPYYRPLSELDQSTKKPALAQCIFCENYFWIEEDIAIAWKFRKIYEPAPHEEWSRGSRVVKRVRSLILLF